MDAAAFRALIQRLEQSAALRPGAYRARVAGLAVLGYTYILGMLALLVVVTGLLVVSLRAVALKLAIPLIVVIGATLKALWVKVPPPDGLPVSPNSAPPLFAMVREVARKLRAPRVDAILAVPELNAGIVQVPRLGVLGWYRNYLLIGLPLLQAVPPEEWQAILAHEMGHLSGSHGRFGAWIYRVRATWGRLLQQLEERRSGIGKFLFGRFVGWFAPYFNAYTFVLARAQEYEADAASAELVGAEVARRALSRIEVVARQADGFWGGLYGGAVHSPEPPSDAQRQLRTALRAAPPGTDAAAWMSAAWRRPTDYSDTHPALADRLKALGWKEDSADGPPPPEPFAGPSAAQAYLGPAEATIEQEFERRWVAAVREGWQRRHAEVTEERRRLAELDGAADSGLSPDAEWQRIRLCSSLGDTARADELAERLLAREPEHLGARFYVGELLLRRGDDAGVAMIEDVMHRDAGAVLKGCEILFEFHWSRGEAAAAERYREMAARREEALQAAQAERLSLTGATEFEPHGLDEGTVATLRKQLDRFHLREAYLARRVVEHLGEIPCYVLGIVPRRPWWRYRVVKEEIELRESIAREVTGPTEEFYVFLLLGNLKGLRGKLQRIPGARVV